MRRFDWIEALPRLAAIIALASLIACAGGEKPGTPTDRSEDNHAEPALEIADVGFETPESVLHDPVADLYLVSNIFGSPTKPDGNGFISRIRPDGTLAELRWIDGATDGVTLNAPKGSAIVGEELFIADVDHVRVFDRTDGSPLRSIPVDGARFLNDLVADGEGGVYVSDSSTRRVHQISPAGAVTLAVEDERLVDANGLAMRGRELLIASEGLFRLTEPGTVELVTKIPAKGLDGVVITKSGDVLISSWSGKAVYALRGDGTVEKVMGGLIAPADIGYDHGRGRLLIPLFHDNLVLIRPVE